VVNCWRQQLTSAPAKPGPNTLLDEELARGLAERVEFGLSVRRAAISLGVNPNTAHRWMRLARLGIMPYAEMLYEVIEAVQSWKDEPAETHRMRGNSTPLGFREHESGSATHSQEKCAKSRGLVPV
jgi:hypothetical protein